MLSAITRDVFITDASIALATSINPNNVTDFIILYLFLHNPTQKQNNDLID